MMRGNRPDLKIWLINLDRAEARRSQMAERLDALGLNYERSSAIDGILRADEFMLVVKVSLVNFATEPCLFSSLSQTRHQNIKFFPLNRHVVAQGVRRSFDLIFTQCIQNGFVFDH